MIEKEILDPYWSSNLKNQIVCKFKYPDGGIVVASVSKTAEGNPDWDQIFAKFTIEQIDANTAEKVKKHEEKQIAQQMEEQRRADNIRREALFMAKSEVFEIDLIRNSTNTKLKSRLRKAASIMEVSVIAAIIAMETNNIEQANAIQSTETTE